MAARVPRQWACVAHLGWAVAINMRVPGMTVYLGQTSACEDTSRECQVTRLSGLASAAWPYQRVYC